jgi:hypothetical protein
MTLQTALAVSNPQLLLQDKAPIRNSTVDRQPFLRTFTRLATAELLPLSCHSITTSHPLSASMALGNLRTHSDGKVDS